MFYWLKLEGREFLKPSDVGSRRPSFNYLRLFPSSLCHGCTFKGRESSHNSRQTPRYITHEGLPTNMSGLPTNMSSLPNRKEKPAGQEHPSLSQLSPPEPVGQGLTTHSYFTSEKTATQLLLAVLLATGP